jgi:parallel beta-helix repeat protein
MHATQLFARTTVFLSMLAVAAPAFPQDAVGRRLIVDDDLGCPGATFSTIQAAVDAAPPGASIRVCAGEYRESLRITTPLALAAERRGEVVVHGTIVVHETEDVTIENLTVNAHGQRWGIVVEVTPRALLRNNTVLHAGWAGIQIFESDDGLVVQNTVRHSGAIGIHLLEAFDYEARQNVTEHNATYGIAIYEGANNHVHSNTSRNNPGHGIAVCFDTRLNRVDRNTVTGNTGAGLFVCADATRTSARNNRLFGNGIDAVDESRGEETAGTDTYWKNNACETSQPAGLCRPAR